jgi:hypothetical protein
LQNGLNSHLHDVKAKSPRSIPTRPQSNRSLLATIGAVLITISLFLPGSRIQTGSNRILVQTGTPTAIALGILVVATLTLSYTKKHSFQIIPAAVRFGLVGHIMVSWNQFMLWLRAGNAQVLMDTYGWSLDMWGLERGWYVLLAGALTVLFSSLLGIRSKKRDTSPVPSDCI